MSARLQRDATRCSLKKVSQLIVFQCTFSSDNFARDSTGRNKWALLSAPAVKKPHYVAPLHGPPKSMHRLHLCVVSWSKGECHQKVCNVARFHRTVSGTQYEGSLPSKVVFMVIPLKPYYLLLTWWSLYLLPSLPLNRLAGTLFTTQGDLGAPALGKP